MRKEMVPVMVALSLQFVNLPFNCHLIRRGRLQTPHIWLLAIIFVSVISYCTIVISYVAIL